PAGKRGVPFRVGRDPGGGPGGSGRRPARVERRSRFRHTNPREPLLTMRNGPDRSQIATLLDPVRRPTGFIPSLTMLATLLLAPVSGEAQHRSDLAMQRSDGVLLTRATTRQRSAAVQERSSDLVLWYPAPATQWVEALPVGNGRLGAMVFGRPVRERIQFNEA